MEHNAKSFLESNSYREYIRFLKETVSIYKSNIVSNTSIISIAILAIVFLKNDSVTLICIPVLVYFSTGLALSIYRKIEWERELASAPGKLEIEILEGRKGRERLNDQ